MARPILVPEQDPELRAIEENMAAGYALWGRHPKAICRLGGDLTVVAGTVPHPMVNFVLGARFGADAEARIDETIALFARRRAPFMWYVGPLSTPPDLEQRLRARGFIPSGSVVGMVLHRPPAPPRPGPDVRLQQLRPDDRSGLAVANAIAAAAFHMPPEVQAYVSELIGPPQGTQVRVYLAWHKGTPAATAVFASAGGAGGLYNVATLPGHRRHGLAGMLVALALKDARPFGLPRHVLQATPQAQHLYETLGFEARCEIRMLLKETR